MKTIMSGNVKIRKERRCFFCSRMFPVGAEMHKVATADNSTVYSTYTCLTCKAIITHIETPDYDEYPEDYVIENMFNDNFEGTPEEYLKWLEDQDDKKAN